jgi:hypothetical protein
MRIIRKKNIISLGDRQCKPIHWHEPFVFTIPPRALPPAPPFPGTTRQSTPEPLDVPASMSTQRIACACRRRVDPGTAEGYIKYTLSIKVLCDGVVSATRVEEILFTPPTNPKPPVEADDFPDDYQTITSIPPPTFSYKQRGSLTLKSIERPPILFTKFKDDGQTVVPISLIYSPESSNNRHARAPVLENCVIVSYLKLPRLSLCCR